MKIVPFFMLNLLLSGSAFAQSWFTAGGIRLGTDWGLTVQQRLLRKTSAELILQSSLSRDEGMVTILAKQHSSLLSRRLNVFMGGGVHQGWTTASVVPTTYEGPKGITLIAGAEATLGRLNMSYDFKPAINVSGGEKAMYWQTGASLRYVIAKKSFLEPDPKKKRQKEREKRRRARAKSRR